MAITNNSNPYWELKDQVAYKLFSSSHMTGSGLSDLSYGAKGNIVVPDIVQTLNVNQQSCNFNAGGDVTLNRININPIKYTEGTEFCKPDLEAVYMKSPLTDVLPGAGNVPERFLAAIVEQRMDQMRAVFDRIIWSSDTTDVGFISFQEGYIRKLFLDPNTIDVTSPVAITVGNVRTEIERMVTGFMSPVLYEHSFDANNGVYIATSFDVNLKLTAALGAQPAAQYSMYERKTYRTPSGVTIDNIWHINGIPIIPFAGFRANTMVLTSAKMMYLAVDLDPSALGFNILDLEPTTMDKKIRYEFNFSFGMGITSQTNLITLYHF
jgi:hypothetical protein